MTGSSETGSTTTDIEKAEDLVAEVTVRVLEHQHQLREKVIGRLTAEIGELADDQIIIEHLESGTEFNLTVALQVVCQEVHVDDLPPSGPAADLARLTSKSSFGSNIPGADDD